MRLDTIFAMTAGSGSSDGRVRVAYIDDQSLFREALVALLEETGAISVVHSCRHGGLDIRSLLDVPVSTILVALDGQASDAMSTVREARQVVPMLPICVLVAVDRLDRAREAIAAGCKGAVSCAAPFNMLVAALENLSNGQPYVDPTLGGRLLAKTGAKAATMRFDENKAGSPGGFEPKVTESTKN